MASDDQEVTPGWRLVHIGFAGDAVDIDGLNPWTAPDSWGPSYGRITVAHPSHPAQRHDMFLYRAPGPAGTVDFAAGEFSNGVWGFFAPVVDDQFEPPPCPGAYLRSDTRMRGVQHAQPGADAATLCGLPPESVVLVRNLFAGQNADDCPECAARLWLLPARRPLQTGTTWSSALDDTRVVLVVAGPSFDATRRGRQRVLTRVDPGPGLEQLRSALALGPVHEDVALMETGALVLALYGGDRELRATVQVLSGGWVRCSLLEGDQRVAEPALLAGWLEEHVPARD